MDKKIREMINRELKINGLPIECHPASWRDGGLAYPSLRDRDDVLRTRSFAQITLSHDKCVRAVMRKFIEDEREFRRIETDAKVQFLDWKERKGRQTGTSTITEKKRTAYQNQDMGLKLEAAFIVIKDNRSETKTNSAVGIGHYLTQKVV
jgi:hypothetical protein